MNTEFQGAKRVSAVELADFMGISTRSLTRMDEKGILVASRTKSGRRVYTTEHLQLALKIMYDSTVRFTRLRFLKNGENSIYGRVCIPRKWLEKLNVTPDDPTACIRFDGESIIITKTADLPCEKTGERIYIQEDENNS